MLLFAFLLSSTLLCLVLGFLVWFKSYRKTMRVILLGLSGLFAVYLWVAYAAAFSPGQERWFSLHKLLMGLGLVSSLLTLALARHFLRDRSAQARTRGRWTVSPFGLMAGAVVLGVALLTVPGQVAFSQDPGGRAFRFAGFGVLIPVVRIALGLHVLYLLESAYRFAQDYQRRIGRLCFIGLAVLAGFHVFTFARALMYRDLPPYFAEASSVVYGVVYPVILIGFLRYRLGSELISVPRGTVYTSATVFLTAAAFMGVALTVFAFRRLDPDFNYFERYLVGFSLSFLAVLILGSGTMRRHIVRLVNAQLYSRKYDYREQFFNLHRTLLSGADVGAALTELVENMKYSVSVGDAHVFVLNWQDGNFYLHENKEEATRRGLALSGDSPLVRHLAREGLPVDLLDPSPPPAAVREAVRAEALVDQLSLDAVFPVFRGDGPQGERLVGILAMKGGRTRPFDEEDMALVSVFANSIGDALFKSRMLKERIERKQFESFHHVASFIIHDTKNQVATLNLLMKNAESNLANPGFQASMMRSIKSCAVNLQNLIDRLTVAPDRLEVVTALHPMRPLLEDVIANAGLASLPGLTLEFRGEDGDPVPMDRQALFFVVRNLVSNALEAMHGKGRIAISFGPVGPQESLKLRGLFGGGAAFLSGYGTYVLVEDSGSGMDGEFLATRLFQPFATTKEKGVGIGLYQCKTLVERMGGRILCHSEPGRGTEFCILLPRAAGDG